MKSAEYVSKKLEEWKKAGNPLMWIAWQVALLCVGWAYVFGARGEYCSPANRRAYFRSKGADHPTIASKCQVIRENNPKDSCNGCKWYPSEKKTRISDCRGFTYWVLLQVYGWKLQGAGATSQWENKKNWKAHGTIDTMPKDTLVCLFQHDKKTGKKKHTGFGYNGETVECQVGVQHKKLDNRWTHWGIPACCDESYSPPEEPKKEDKKPVKKTIRKGNTSSLVKECQTMLQKLGYDLGICGVDGDFGQATEKAVKQFQKDHGLTADGVVGEKTWAALEKATEAPTPVKKYKIVVTDLTKAVADEIQKKYGGTVTAE